MQQSQFNEEAVQARNTAQEDYLHHCGGGGSYQSAVWLVLWPLVGGAHVQHWVNFQNEHRCSAAAVTVYR
jgi:hypothetical protein